MIYPIPYGVADDYKVEYNDFVSVILGGISGVGFGLKGGYRQKFKNKQHKTKKGKKTTRKHNKSKSNTKKGKKQTKKHTRKHRK